MTIIMIKKVSIVRMNYTKLDRSCTCGKNDMGRRENVLFSQYSGLEMFRRKLSKIPMIKSLRRPNTPGGGGGLASPNVVSMRP